MPDTLSSKKAPSSKVRPKARSSGAKSAHKSTRRVPNYDQDAVGRVAVRVELGTIELVSSFFDVDNASPLPAPIPEAMPHYRIDVEWELADEEGLLGVLLTFAASFDEGRPYELIARYRTTYEVHGKETVSERDLEQFVYWNAVLNTWPYWREFVQATLSRAELPKVVVPVMRLPKQVNSEGS